VKALVAGGAGFLGSHLVDRLLAEGHAVDVLDDLSSGSLANLSAARAGAGQRDGSLKIHHLDVRTPDLAELFRRRRPDVVYHLAQRSPLVAGDARAAEHAVVTAVNLLEAARECGATKVVAALEARHLYGAVGIRDLPVKDGHPWAPVTAYGVALRATADLLAVYRAVHAVEFTALALATVFGPRQRYGVVASFVRRWRKGEPCTIEGDGRQTRDLLYVDDAVDALVRAATRGTGLVVNVGTGAQTSVRDLERLVTDGGVAPEWAPARPGAPERFALSSVRARIHLGWAPWTALADGLAATRQAASDG
jgi:UDP-glucose 4-epimerase